MTKVEIQKTLRQKKLPFTWEDRLLALGMLVFLVVIFFAELHQNKGWDFMAAVKGTLPFCFFMMLGCYWQFVLNKSLLAYSSSLPKAEKETIIESLTKLPDVLPAKESYITRKANFCEFTYEPGWWVSYRVQVFYDGAGYYVSSKRRGKSLLFSYTNSRKIIEHIRVQEGAKE